MLHMAICYKTTLKESGECVLIFDFTFFNCLNHLLQI